VLGALLLEDLNPVFVSEDDVFMQGSALGQALEFLVRFAATGTVLFAENILYNNLGLIVLANMRANL